MVERKKSGAKAEPFRFRQSRALLRKLVENAAVATFLTGPDGALLYANRAFYELVGYEPNEPIAMRIEQLVHPDDVAVARRQVESLVGGEIESYRGERRYLRKNGEPIWVLSCGSVLRDEKTGRQRYLIIQAIDIDRQKLAEAALAESESRWNFALESAGQGVWDHDFRHGRLFYSRMWKLMRGLDPDAEVNGELDVWIAGVHPDDRANVLECIRRQDSGEVDFSTFEYRERHRDGRWIWILSRGRAVEWTPDGRPSRIIGTDTDITSLKVAEARLAAETERLRVTLHSIGDGVISTDAAGRVAFMNPIAELMTGWPSAEASGRRVEEVFAIVAAASGRPASNPVAECLARDRVHDSDEDVVLVARTGERRNIRDTAAPVRMPSGEIIGAVLVFQDISDMRTAQRELAHSAMHDGLTGLPNRSAFERRLAVMRDEARRELREHALCFIDLDRFKAVNDSAGHAAGDSLLREVGRVIRSACRGEDFAARIGGDEFALLLPDCSLARAESVAQSVLNAIAGLRFLWQGTVHKIGASIGITAITQRSSGAADLLREADVACYAAKADGRNRVAIFAGNGAASRHLERRA